MIWFYQFRQSGSNLIEKCNLGSMLDLSIFFHSDRTQLCLRISLSKELYLLLFILTDTKVLISNIIILVTSYLVHWFMKYKHECLWLISFLACADVGNSSRIWRMWPFNCSQEMLLVHPVVTTREFIVSWILLNSSCFVRKWFADSRFVKIWLRLLILDETWLHTA